MPKIMYTISYAFNIALLIVIIVITTTEWLFECICLLSRMLQNLGSCVLLEGFTNFAVDPHYDPLSLVMIVNRYLKVKLEKLFHKPPTHVFIQIQLLYMYVCQLYCKQVLWIKSGSKSFILNVTNPKFLFMFF